MGFFVLLYLLAVFMAPFWLLEDTSEADY